MGRFAWTLASNGLAAAQVGGATPMKHSVPVSFVLVGALLVGLSACTGGPRTFPVKGTVMYNGKPVPKGTVLFTPVTSGPTATGEINKNGTYQLTTYKPGDGACLGEDRVESMATATIQSHTAISAPRSTP